MTCDTLPIAREIGKLATAEERQPLIDDVTAGRLNTEEMRNIVRTLTASTSATAAPSTSAEPATHDATSIQGISGTPSPSAAPGMVANALARMSKQATNGPKPSTDAEKERAPIARLHLSMGTVRVILARWQHALPEMPPGESNACNPYKGNI